MLSEKKVTESEIASGVVSLPDKPSEEGIGAEDLKARFDLFPKMIATKFNALIDELLANGLKELGGLNETEIAALINQSKEELAQSLAEHSENKENPHEVTAAQVGTWTSYAIKNYVNDSLGSVEENIELHKGARNNPHGVTAEQIGSLGEERIADTLNDVDQTKIPTVKAVNEGISFAGGGDMMRSTYDPQGFSRDVFAYADAVGENAKTTASQLSKSALNQAKTYADDLYTNAASKTEFKALQNDVSELETEFGELETELKNSVGDGKTLVANAITAKGVSTATDAEFATLASNIAKISTGSKTAYGTGTATDGGSDKVDYVQVTNLAFRPSKVLIWVESSGAWQSFKFITTEYVIDQKENTNGYDSVARETAGYGGTSFTAKGFKTNLAGRGGKTFYYFAIE